MSEDNAATDTTLVGGQPPAGNAAAPGQPAAGDEPKQPAGETAGAAGDSGEGAAGEAGGEGSSNLDTYADFNLPEGVTLDNDALAEAAPILKELGATQEQAQKLVDTVAGLVQAGEQKQGEAFTQLVNDWREQSMKDSEFGGDQFEQNVKLAQTALEKFGTPELKQVMSDYGIGNHPEIIRFMVKVGRLTQEDAPGATGAASSPQKDRLSILYPTN